MAQKLPARKIRQIERIVGNRKKAERLRSWTMLKGGYRNGLVSLMNIAGKSRALKVTDVEREAKANLMILQRTHKKAIKSGQISPKTYELVDSKYVYAGPNFSVMETVPGFGFDRLISTLKYLDDPYPLSKLKYLANSYPFNFYPLSKSKGLNLFNNAIDFCRKNPTLTLKRMNDLRKELLENLHILSKGETAFSCDFRGDNNVIVLGFNKSTGKIKIGLIDQVYPGGTQSVRQILAKKRTKKK